MKFGMYAVYDQVAKLYKTPFIFPNDATAQRAFAGEVNRENSEISSNPADYTLVRIAEFDDNEGIVVPLDAPISLGLGVKYVKPD